MGFEVRHTPNPALRGSWRRAASSQRRDSASSPALGSRTEFEPTVPVRLESVLTAIGLSFDPIAPPLDALPLQGATVTSRGFTSSRVDRAAQRSAPFAVFRPRGGETRIAARAGRALDGAVSLTIFLPSGSRPGTRCTRSRHWGADHRRTTLPWGLFPFDVSDASSDLHRVCLARLCCTYRFSQPLGALIPLAPPRPCLVPNPSLGFLLPEASPSS